MKTMKKKITVAVTGALLAFPLSSAIALACVPNTPVLVATSTNSTSTTSAPSTTITELQATEAAETAIVAYEAGPTTTLAEVVTVEGLKAAADTAVAAVTDVEAKTAFELRVTNRAEVIATAKTALQGVAAEAAVVTYEAGPKTTLAEVSTVEGLKAAADTAVAAVTDVEAKTAFELRVTNRAEVIATAKATLQGEAAEAAVAAYEIGPITTLAEVATAEDLKAAAVTAVSIVGDAEAKIAFKLRVTDRSEAITTAKAALSVPVVDADGNEITPATAFSDFIDSLQLALAFDPARKCELNERHALRKLAQAHKLMKDGNIEASQVCLNEYTDKIAKAQTFLLEVEKTDSETAKTLDEALTNLDSNNIQVLSNLIDKLPPQAAEKLALNVVRSMEKAVAKIQKEEAKVAPVTTPETTPVTDSNILEKQAQVALESFKKSLNQKGKIHFEDQKLDQDRHDDDGDKNVVEQSKPEQKTSEIEQNTPQVTQKVTQNKIENKMPQAQSITQSRQNHVTALPVKTEKVPTVICPTDKEDRNQQEAHGNDKREGGQDNRSDHQ